MSLLSSGSGISNTRLMPALCAIAVASLSVVLSGRQAKPTVLSETLRAHVKGERFDIVTSIRGFPLGVRSGLQALFGSPDLDIAEPGEKFQATDVMTVPRLPSRRLLAGGCSTDHCLVHYERGGFAHAWFVAVFHWAPDETRFEWGGIAPGRLATVEDIRKAILSGAIKPSTNW
jgi:hypothetical protein